MRHLPSFRALRCFEAVVRTGTLTAAAHELNITPGAVSRQITALEAQVGAALMRRHRKGVAVTSQGQALSDRLAAAFAAIGEAVDDVVAARDDATLTLNVYPTFAIQWLMPRLADFYAIAPDVDLRIRPSLQEHPFALEEIDVAIMIGAPQDKHLQSRPLFPRRFTPVCNPETFQVAGPLTPADLRHQRIFYSDMHIRQWQLWLDALGLEMLDLPAIGIRFENSSLAYQAARQGVGFSIGQPTLLRTDLESGRLIAPFAEIVEDKRRYVVASRVKDAERRSVRLFMDWITAAAKLSEQATAAEKRLASCVRSDRA